VATPFQKLCVAALLIAGCDGGPAPARDGGGVDAEPMGQGGQARAALVVNEVSPRGGGADWLELLNRSDDTLDLCEFFVTDALDRLDHYLALGGVAPPDACEPRSLEPGQYLVVVADDDASIADHAPFALSIDDGVHVVSLSGRAVDSLLYLYSAPEGEQTLSRVPDGEGLFYLAEPTPGEPNAEGSL